MDLASLRTTVQAPVLAPGEEGWDDARQAWNLIADQNPAAIVLAEGVADVVAAVDFARENGLRLAAQSTGHGASALVPLHDTVLVRTIRMNGVSVDPGERLARVEAGALSGDLAAAAGSTA
jgi:FAD/FMN-containing dehydrogenase